MFLEYLAKIMELTLSELGSSGRQESLISKEI